MATFIPLHQLSSHVVNVSDFLFWAYSNGVGTLIDTTMVGFGSEQVERYKLYLSRQVPNRFNSQIHAIKFLREMIEDRRSGLKETKEFVEAVWRTPKPVTFKE